MLYLCSSTDEDDQGPEYSYKVCRYTVCALRPSTVPAGFYAYRRHCSSAGTWSKSRPADGEQNFSPVHDEKLKRQLDLRKFCYI